MTSLCSFCLVVLISIAIGMEINGFVLASPINSQKRLSQIQNHDQSKEGGSPFSQENLEQMGMEMGQQAAQQMGQMAQQEFVHGLHKIEDKIDRQTDKFIDDMSNREKNLKSFTSSKNLLVPKIEESYLIKKSSTRGRKKIGKKPNITPFPNFDESEENFENLLPIERTLEKNFFAEDANNDYEDIPTTDTYSPSPAVEDNYKPLPLDDEIKNIETSSYHFESKATSPSASNSGTKPPSVPELPFGLPSSYSSQGSQTPTLILGGFSILVMPMPGLTPNNVANLFQPGQQLGQASGINPFVGTAPVSG